MECFQCREKSQSIDHTIGRDGFCKYWLAKCHEPLCEQRAGPGDTTGTPSLAMLYSPLPLSIVCCDPSPVKKRSELKETQKCDEQSGMQPIKAQWIFIPM